MVSFICSFDTSIPEVNMKNLFLLVLLQDSAQERKVTITLIAVVILYLVCQTPNALQLLHIIHTEDDTIRNRGTSES